METYQAQHIIYCFLYLIHFYCSLFFVMCTQTDISPKHNPQCHYTQLYIYYVIKSSHIQTIVSISKDHSNVAHSTYLQSMCVCIRNVVTCIYRRIGSMVRSYRKPFDQRLDGNLQGIFIFPFGLYMTICIRKLCTLFKITIIQLRIDYP